MWLLHALFKIEIETEEDEEEITKVFVMRPHNSRFLEMRDK